jgi:hypothetical protein
MNMAGATEEQRKQSISSHLRGKGFDEIIHWFQFKISGDMGIFLFNVSPTPCRSSAQNKATCITF